MIWRNIAACVVAQSQVLRHSSRPQSLEFIKFQTSAAMWQCASYEWQHSSRRAALLLTWPATDQTVASPSRFKQSWTLKKEAPHYSNWNGFLSYHKFQGQVSERRWDDRRQSAAVGKEFIMAERWSYIASEGIDIFLLDVFNLPVKNFPTKEHKGVDAPRPVCLTLYNISRCCANAPNRPDHAKIDRISHNIGGTETHSNFSKNDSTLLERLMYECIPV